MSFADHITRSPHPFDPDRAADTRALVPWAKGAVREVLEGTGGSSPYLRGLIGKEADWLQGALDDPDAALSQALQAARQANGSDAAARLRQAKRRVALLTALADLAGVWPLETVTGALTDLADAACHAALRIGVAQQVKRGKLPGVTEDDLDSAGGMVVLAMGKMGAHELNYSSDIDLICLFDETRFDPDSFFEVRQGFVRATRQMSALLSDSTGDGYVFRTDLRLRPDPAVTPVCMAMEAAERYYESLGRTWERAAYIKARACAGDIAAGERFLQTLRPFVWRKHLDFAAIEDAHNIRLRIREHKGLGGPITLPGHNMKLGRGGIREIEFFTQTRQLIAGGRDPELRARGTVPGLGVLADKGWVPLEVARELAEHYRAHREVEHRVQMVEDAQTHDLPNSDDGFRRLACLMGQDPADLRRDLTRRLEAVHHLTEDFFAPDAAGEPEPAALQHHDITARWPRYAALRSGRAVEIFKRLKPEILRRLDSTARPEEALLAFDGFLEGLPAGVQVFSLFEANPQLIDLLVDITGTSPDLARHLSRNAGVFDAVIGGDFFSPWPGADALHADLAEVLAREPDYESQLDATRRWGKEWHFRVGVHLLRGLIDADEAGYAYADLAGATLSALWPVVQTEFALKHGAPPGRGAIVLGMGSLGARRLHARSDLDVIVIYDPQGDAFSEGRKPLAARQYYARLTQALITAMTAPMAEGKLYEVDMRLRPSGNQGPVATSWGAFQTYQRENAWVWEHLALTRARPVAGPDDLAEDVTEFRQTLLSAPRDRADILAEVAQMRARIAAAKAPSGAWDAKLGPGRMQDIELVAQAGALLSGTAPGAVGDGLAAAAQAGWLSSADADHLAATYALCWSLQCGTKLISDSGFDPDTQGAGGCAFLRRLTGADSIGALAERLMDMTARSASIIDAALPEIEESR
ncbi:glutamine-synthetase adenylyltransferase [Thalassococcus sp. BH17M4-6]|uniref:[protein-PII] uridylyltransferase family protein n=1 Tax=Thalassococcus sp. BH17M4-6 TaxID=3413148 RepID=UPI003BBEFB4F